MKIYPSRLRQAVAACCGFALLVIAQPIAAKPIAPALFCADQPDSPLCAGTSVSCKLCHTSTAPLTPGWNAFGNAVWAKLGGPLSPSTLPVALSAIMDDDSDGDGVANAEEIAIGTLPGDPKSAPGTALLPYGEPNPGYKVGEYDTAYAYRRVAIAFCGRSATYGEMKALAAAADQNAALHAKVDECLASAYWRDDALPRLADPKIRPIDFQTSYRWDYRLWRWVMTGDRDMRELLLADYHIREETPGQLVKVTGLVLYDTGVPCADAADCAGDETCGINGTCAHLDGGQLLAVERRAGMITTTWFHFYNTMFSALPRQTAAQAYRAYAGLDIARQQGIAPVDGEPLDVDNKGVQQAECKQCHSTLDPLSYAYALHHGIGGTGPPSAFDAERPHDQGLWITGEAPAFVVFGQEVKDVRGWAQVVADSDAFKRTITEALYWHALGHRPRLEDLAEFTAIWQSLPELGWTANATVHAIVDTTAFGAP